MITEWPVETDRIFPEIAAYAGPLFYTLRMLHNINLRIMSALTAFAEGLCVATF